jgi:hypothetical protein
MILALYSLEHIGENGFGVWKDDILETAPLDFNPGLRIIGYDTKNLPLQSKHLSFILSKRSRFNFKSKYYQYNLQSMKQ